jgi:hypothetical protein
MRFQRVRLAYKLNLDQIFTEDRSCLVLLVFPACWGHRPALSAGLRVSGLRFSAINGASNQNDACGILSRFQGLCNFKSAGKTPHNFFLIEQPMLGKRRFFGPCRTAIGVFLAEGENGSPLRLGSDSGCTVELVAVFDTPAQLRSQLTRSISEAFRRSTANRLRADFSAGTASG